MKKNIFLKALGASFLVLGLVAGFTSCASTKTVEFDDLTYYKSPYYDQFVKAFTANPKDEGILDILDEWNKNEPDGDMYKSYFTYYYNQAVTDDFNKHVEMINLAIEYLYEGGIGNYPNRIDLWDLSLQLFNQFGMKGNSKVCLLNFISCAKAMEDSNSTWYADFNEPVGKFNFEDEDSAVRKIIISYSNALIDNNPDENSPIYFEEIYATLAKLYPNDSHVFNELGYSQFIQSKFSEGLINYEKAYKIDNSNKTAMLNVCIAALATNNKEKLEEYSKIVYETGDKQLIKTLENQIEVFSKINK